MKPINQIKIIEGKNKKRIMKILEEQFGIKEIPGKMIQSGKEKIFIYTGHLTDKEIHELNNVTVVEKIGIYLAKENEGEIRLSIEGSQILKDQITKNIVELNEEEMQTWMMGHELLKKTGLKGFVIMKYKDDMLGTGKASEEKITNFIPKSRRLKDKSIEG